MKTNTVYTTNKAPFYRRPLVIILAVILLSAIAVGASEVSNTTHLLHKQKTPKPAITAGQTTKGEPVDQPAGKPTPSTNQSQVPAGPQGDSKENVAPSSVLLAPSGNFVSSHKNISQSDSLSSVCTSSAGAVCQIVFTSGNSTKYLPEQKTDRGGSTYWNSWVPSNIGLTPGSWQIKAVVSLNGQTKTSVDTMNLEIEQ